MKKLCVVLAVFLCWSAGFSRHVPADDMTENRGGQVLQQPTRSDLSKRIEAFAVKNGADPEIAPELAELLVACEQPRVLAAIAAKESNFNDRARGKAGEVGMYQVIPRDWGHPGKTWREQTKASERILQELLEASNGDISVAVRKYNGSGPRAVRYSKHVLAMARSI